MIVVAKLIGGPQDGAQIAVFSSKRPVTVFVGKKWLGDGKAAWGRDLCDRFPVKYVLGKDWNYYFTSYFEPKGGNP